MRIFPVNGSLLCNSGDGILLYTPRVVGGICLVIDIDLGSFPVMGCIFPPESPSYYYLRVTAMNICHNYSEVCCCTDLPADTGLTVTSAAKGCMVCFYIHGGHVTYQVSDLIGYNYNGRDRNSGCRGKNGRLIFAETSNLRRLTCRLLSFLGQRISSLLAP